MVVVRVMLRRGLDVEAVESSKQQAASIKHYAAAAPKRGHVCLYSSRVRKEMSAITKRTFVFRVGKSIEAHPPPCWVMNPGPGKRVRLWVWVCV